MIAREQGHLGRLMLGGVGEFGRAGLETERAGGGVVGDLAERNDHADRWQLLQRFFQERAASQELWLIPTGRRSILIQTVLERMDMGTHALKSAVTRMG